MLKNILLCASAIALMASCAEEESPWTTTGTSELKTLLPEDDLTFGYNSIITETDSLSSVSIPLNTDVAPEISCSDGLADLQCVNIDGKYYLQVANPEQAKLGVDEVTLTIKGHPELTKSFYFTVRNSIANTRALEPTDQEDKILQRFAKVFSQGQYVWKGTTEDHPLSPIFDSKVLYASVVTDTIISLFNLDHQFANTEEEEKAQGSTLEEYNSSFSFEAGLNNIPAAKANISVNGFGTFTDHSKHYYEYLTKSKSHVTAAAALSVSMTSTPAHDKYWKELITKELDNLLNNPTSKEYQAYPETDEGACKIIEAYGSHLLTYCKLGTKATLNFRKKQDLSKTSVEFGAKLKIQQLQDNLGRTDTSDAPPADSNAVKAAQYVDDKLFSASAGFSKSWNDLLEEIEVEWDVKLIGGNSNTTKDYDEWNATDDPEKWIPVSFRKDKKKSAELRAIYELCQDAESPRCQTLKRVLEEVDKDGYCPFARYMLKEYDINLNMKETEWVLAGVYVDVSVEDDKSDGVQKNVPKPIRMPLPANQNIKATFYPFTDLAFNKGKCLDTQDEKFGRCVRAKCHYWYYAMLMRDDFAGIEEFRLVEDDKVSEWNSREKGYLSCLKGDEFGDGWRAGETGNFVLMCKPIAEGDTKTQPLTGFRLEAYDKNKDASDDYTGKSKDPDDYRLLAVSAPTGPGLYGEDNNYRKYWAHNEFHGPDYVYTVKNVLDDKGKVNDVYHLKFIHQPYHLFLSTTAKPIELNDLHIEHPSDMRH